MRRVAGKRVESEGKAKADDSTDEEEGEYQLFLELNVGVRPSQMPNSDHEERDAS